MIRTAALLLALTSPAAAEPFFLDITPDFELTDQRGQIRSDEDFAGKPMLIFFGYTKCESICSVALPSIAEALDLLGPDATRLSPILVTIDPANDTPEQMAKALPDYHPDFIGLTGSEESLAAVRAQFQVEREKLFETPYGEPVYAHGSFVYITDSSGKVQSALPPILGPERIAELLRARL
ncbi:SCO family protein [Algicella marina]|uniref:Redoxin domain-containing protein n=1 Tax=Algicella marina TaxID=2683284 RepID=A0A6P1SZ44_9RHOB|nr:SCO family protein [Algicella marina]QHQ34741.1 redoxin domain-containing protein [Algicella marina]